MFQLAKLCVLCASELSSSRRILTPGLRVEDLPADEFKKFFRFTPPEFEVLFEATSLPNYKEAGYNCNSRRALLMLLLRVAYPCRLVNISSAFGIS